MDTELLSSICNGLGYRREDEDGTLMGYVKGEYCLDNLKDLQRFLRRDDPQGREVFKQICKWNVVSRDLIPIIEYYQNDRNLIINCVKVLVFLTMPVDPVSDNIAQQIDHLWHIKAAVARHVTIAVIVSLLEDPLEHLERNAFTEDDWKLVQLVLTLFRNTLAIQDILLQHKASGSSTHFLHLRDRFLELLFQENVMDLILVLTQHLDGSCSYLRQDNLLFLEVFHYIFHGHEPELVANKSGSSQVDGSIEMSLNTLKSMMEEEQEKRRVTKMRNSSSNLQFNGAFTRLTMDGSRTIFKGNPTASSGNRLLMAPKVQRGPLKRIAWDHGSLPLTRNNIMLSLHDLLEHFLSGPYNVLMQTIREDIEKEHQEFQTSDIMIFYHVACFVTSFQYHRVSIAWTKVNVDTETSAHMLNDNSTFNGDICGPIAETMNEAMFSLVIDKWRYTFETLKQTNEYKFLSSAGSLLKSMIVMLDLVLKLAPESAKEHQTAHVLLYKLFYDQTDQGMTYFLLNVLKSFDTHKQPRSDLADLVETVQMVLQLMENLQQHGTLRVSRKKRKGRKKKTLGDEDKKESGKPIQELDNGKNVCDHHENDYPCESNLDSFRKEENMVPPSEELCIPIPYRGSLPNNSAHLDEPDYSSDDEHMTINEVDFRVSNVLSSFANNSVIQRLCWLLRFYKSNPARINKHIIDILQRISDDLELSPMLYQLSVLDIFYGILVDQKSSKCNDHVSISDFLTNFVRKMLKKLKNQPLLFVELLFWKTRKECHYINTESLLHSVHNLRGEFKGSEGTELHSTKDIEMPFRKSIADSLGDDEAVLMAPQTIFCLNSESSEKNSQTDGNENEREGAALAPKLEVFQRGKRTIKNGSEGSSSNDYSKRASTRKTRCIFDQEQERKIRDLYEKYKDDQNCTQLIAHALDPHGKVSLVQVSCKLKQLGLSAPLARREYSAKTSNVGEDQAGTMTTSLNGPVVLEDTSLHVRKRIRVFNQEQEAMVRNLYEKFKDHEKCSHMIANALDADNIYTSVQISRKLKQLGLRVPRKRRFSKGSKCSGDEFPKQKELSDDEKLVTLLGRCKGKSNRPVLQKNDSDDELLSTMLKAKHKKNIEENIKSKLEVAALAENDSDDGHLSTMLIRDKYPKSSPPSITGTTTVLVNSDTMEPNEVKVGRERSLASEVCEDNLPNMIVDEYDELADSGDDASLAASVRTGARTLKMVIDDE